MTGARVRAAALLCVGLLAAAAVAVVVDRSGGGSEPTASSTERPTLMLLTSLPLVFAEEFGLDGGGSPALQALETHYRVEPIAVADARSLRPGGLLLMAQPLAQPAEALVDLDLWVRAGGKLVLLADPMLEWHSERPLGDAFRPPPMFADTGLLRHWGLRLDAPDDRGPKALPLGRYEVLTVSPGSLVGGCAIQTHALVARCKVEKGVATIIADADFLNVEDLDGPTQHNLDALLAELDRLEPR